MARPDHYATLGVPGAASAEQIRAAYRIRARQLHPDRVADPGALRADGGAVSESYAHAYQLPHPVL